METEEITESVVKIMSELFQRFGLSLETSEIAIAIVGLSIFIGGSFWIIKIVFSWIIKEIFLKNVKERLENLKADKDLRPEFDYLTIKELRNIFIQTRYARINPNRYDNPDEAHKHNETSKLIPFMLKKSFNEKVANEKFYLILADSGMGKTAFMVNLYMACHSFFRKKQKMKLLRFQPSDINNPVDVVKRIQKIKDEEKDVKNTILLLDGLDEDPFILSKDPDISDDEAFKTRINEIVSQTMDFCNVVITCRTQYFPQQERQDYELNIRKPDNKGFHKLNKYYLFPFSRADVDTFLNKKYGIIRFWHWSKKRKARQLVENSHRLMSRPMLMSYLDDLVLGDKEYSFSYEIYETLIGKWLSRESEKWKKSREREEFIENLHDFTREAALHIYRSWESKGMLHISKDEALQIAKTYQSPLKPDEVKGKSLLTCDPLLNWKFAHKSILEYFLAKKCAEDLGFALDFNFAGMDMARHFYKEMWPIFDATYLVKVEGGTFLMGSSSDDEEAYDWEKPQHEVTVSDFYILKTPVTQKQWRDVMGADPQKLRFKGRDDCPVEMVSWNDVQDFIEKLKTKTGKTFRLPSEAEWEYAARGGNKSKGFKFSGSDNLDEVGWYSKNSKKTTHPVAQKNPNELGVYDMSGNVWEWCQDKWYDTYEGAPNDGSAWESGESSSRVLRGGSWNDFERFCRVAFRFNGYPLDRDVIVGFRLVLVP